jgi:hypothetical protein
MEVLTLLRDQGPMSKEGLMPRTIITLCQELHSPVRGFSGSFSQPILEVTRVIATTEGGVLVRMLSLEGAEGGARSRPMVLVLLEPVAERAMVNGGLKERFGLTEREWELTQALIKGFTNKEIGNALGITEPTVKAHIKHTWTR